MGEIHLWTLQVFRHWNRFAMVFLFLPRIAPLQQSLGPWPQGRGAWLEVMHGMETLETGGLHGFFNRMRSCDISDLRSYVFCQPLNRAECRKRHWWIWFFFSVWHEKLRNFWKTPLSTLLNAEHSSRLWCCPNVLMQARNANQWPSNRQHLAPFHGLTQIHPTDFYSNLLPETPWLTTHPNHPLAARKLPWHCPNEISPLWSAIRRTLRRATPEGKTEQKTWKGWTAQASQIRIYIHSIPFRDHSIPSYTIHHFQHEKSCLTPNLLVYWNLLNPFLKNIF